MDFHNCSMTSLDLDLKDRSIQEDKSFTVSTIESIWALKSAVGDMMTHRSFVEAFSSIVVPMFEV